jgi:choline dehydrogenase
VPQIGNSAPLGPFAKREVMPGIWQAPSWSVVYGGAYPTGTKRAPPSGHDTMSVVDSNLKVGGTNTFDRGRLNPAPHHHRNTMAPCVIIGERAAQILRAQHDHPM